MRRIFCLLILTPLLGSALYGDWKIVTRTGQRTVTEFLKGGMMRTDSPPAYSTVADFEHRRQLSWRSDLRQYTIFEWPPNPPQGTPEGPVIHVERNTTDTGERKQFFGRTARHLITRTTRSDAPESVTDAWYVDAPGLPKWKGGGGNSVAILTTSIGGERPAAPRIEVKRTGPATEGLAVWERTTSSMTVPGGTPRNFDRVSEVIELVEGPLPDKLFRQPDGYQKVTNLPMTAMNHHASGTWAELLRAHWEMVAGWVSGL